MAQDVILLVNLGSPDSYQIKDVRRYLAQFLMDPYVIDVPFLLRALIVYGFILPFRPKKTSHAYQSVWTEMGSPLVSTSKKLAEGLSNISKFPVYLAMRYQNPSIEKTIQILLEENPDCQSIYLYPLYPHYAFSTTKTVIEEVKSCLKKMNYSYSLFSLKPFYDNTEYVKILASGIKEKLPENVSHLIFSYHGLPERHLKKTDPSNSHCLVKKDCCKTPHIAWQTCYQHHCLRTTDMVLNFLNKPALNVINAFQSRLGKDPWLSPYTESVVRNMAKSGVQHLAVVCPAFVTDCLETLEEINMGIRELFLDEGGKSFTYIPCLNTDQKWIQLLHQWSLQPQQFELVLD